VNVVLELKHTNIVVYARRSEEEPRQWLKPELQVRRGDCGSVGRFKGGACVMCEFNSSRVIAYECNRLSVVGLVV
jgi:hypothetical protein